MSLRHGPNPKRPPGSKPACDGPEWGPGPALYYVPDCHHCRIMAIARLHDQPGRTILLGAKGASIMGVPVHTRVPLAEVVRAEALHFDDVAALRMLERVLQDVV